MDDSTSRLSGTLRGPLQGSGPSSRLDAEDIELPILEATTALSDGYASPRPLTFLGGLSSDSDEDGGLDRVRMIRNQQRSDDKSEEDVEAGAAAADGTELRPSTDSVVLNPKATQRRGCCGGLCSFILGHWSKAVLLAIIITVIVLFSLRGVRIFGEILHFFERWNNWGGWGIFIGLFIVNVTLFLPGVALILGAGFVFGFWKGLLAVWVGGAIGQALAFLLARYLVRDAVVHYVAKKWPKWELVEHMLTQEGWKVVLLLRLSPIVPWNLLNITMATTAIPFWQFAIASAVGIGFETSVLCYFGSLAQNIRDIVSGEAKPQGPVVYILAGVSLFFCTVAAVLATIYVRRALKRADAFRQAQGPDEESGFLPQALPQEGSAFATAAHQRGLEPSELYAPSDDSSPRSLARAMPDSLKAGSGFSSDESGGVRMLPMSGGFGDRDYPDGGASAFPNGAGGSYIGSPVSSAGSSPRKRGAGRNGPRQRRNDPPDAVAVVSSDATPQGAAADGSSGSQPVAKGSADGGLHRTGFGSVAADAGGDIGSDRRSAPSGGGLDFGSSGDELSPRALRSDLRPLEGVVTRGSPL